MLNYYRNGFSAILKVEGEDAFDYLQSQFSQDLRLLKVPGCVYGLWLDRKGKVQADSFILRPGDGFFLLVSYHCGAESLMEKVVENIIADDVEVSDETGLWSGLSFWGDTLPAFLEKQGFGMPSNYEMGTTGEGLMFWPGRRSRSDSLDVLVPCAAFAKQAPAWLDVLSGQACEVGKEDMDRERILSGIPAIPADIGPGNLPQEGGLEVDALSFNKGCYLGQEVMARLHAMGQVQRKLTPVILGTWPSGLPVPLFSGTKEVGMLTSATRPETGKWQGLAMLKTRGLAEAPFGLQPGGHDVFPVNA